MAKPAGFDASEVRTEAHGRPNQHDMPVTCSGTLLHAIVLLNLATTYLPRAGKMQLVLQLSKYSNSDRP